jgi:hypothetical protein
MRLPLTLRDLAMRRSSIVLALTLAAAALLGGALWYWFNDLRRIAHGPEPVTLAQVSQMGVEAAGRWLKITSDVRPGHLLKTTTRRRRGGESVTNHFVLIKDKAVVVETSMAALPATFLAWSSVFEEGSGYYQRARQQLNLWAGASRVPLSPLLLRTSAEVAFTQWATGSAIAVTAILLLVVLLRTLRAMQDFTRIGPIARLRKSVRAEVGLPALVAEIDQQLAMLDPRARRTGPLLLPSWLVSVTPSSFSLMSASDVVWVAPYKVTRKLYAVIPISKSHQIQIMSRGGQSVALQVTQERIGDVLTTLSRWAPWAVIGPDRAMEARFGKATGWGALRRLFGNMPSRAELIAAVDGRREHILAVRAAQSGAASP